MTDQTNKPATERPPDWAIDMAKIPFDPMADRAAFSMTTSGPSPMTPRGETAAPHPPANTSGWQAERRLGPQPGIDLIDRMCINADQRERQQAQQPDVMQFMMTMQRQQTQILAALAALVARTEDQKPKKASESKDKQP